MKHLLSTTEMEREDILAILSRTRDIARDDRGRPALCDDLDGRTVASVFFEDSTRTRLSFETAARRLSADVLGFSAASSSLSKGESVRDTIETLSAMGADVLVIRHRSSGVPRSATEWTDAAVVNAGDGWHQHPTQALLDAFVISQEFGRTGGLEGLRVAIVGDLRHSRVARSNIDLLGRLGAEVVLVSPPSLAIGAVATGRVEVSHDLDEHVDSVDVLYMLRVQRERMANGAVPSLEEYSRRYALDASRARRLRKGAIVMHPGPMNRGVEMRVDPADLPGCRILDQVAAGVAVRMAVLSALIGSPSTHDPGGSHES
jgi:aspartate carbamoyltransferase catalytic subunit